MKIINVGNTFDPVDNSVKIYDLLPAQGYVVRFSKERGFFLEVYDNMQSCEEKVYGNHEQKVEKVLNAFKRFDRNLGVILSGEKGIGKSLFARMLAKKAVELNIPFIIVDQYIYGIASYLENIQQEVLVLFDEFDKTFKETDDDNPQSTLLSLFDGVSGGKKLFVITCNDHNRLDDFLINRPGRFHYHFRFGYPAEEEICGYLMDNLDEKYHAEISDVVSFSKIVPLNYDCLRAIVFELNSGIGFKEAILDLNIIKTSHNTYDVSAYFENGRVLTSVNRWVNLSRSTRNSVYFQDETGYVCEVTFNGDSCVMGIDGYLYVKKDNLEIDWETGRDTYKECGIKHIILRLPPHEDVHYAF